jgi:hypothetical protein
VVGVSLDPRSLGAGHPDPIALDRAVQTMLLEEGVEIRE